MALHYVWSERVTYAGNHVHKHNFHRIMTTGAMKKRQNLLANQYQTPLSCIAFEHITLKSNQYILYNEMKNKIKNIRR